MRALALEVRSSQSRLSERGIRTLEDTRLLKALLGARLTISLALLAVSGGGVGTIAASPKDLVGSWMGPALDAPREEQPRIDLGPEISDLLGLHQSSLPYLVLLPALLLSLGLNARYRQRLWELRTRLGLIMDSTEDAIFTKSLNGEITAWNQGAQRLYGYEAEEVLGRPLSILFPGDEADEPKAILRRIRQGQSIQGVRHTCVTRNGTVLKVSLAASPVLDRQGRVQGGVVIGRNVTLRQEVEEASRTSEARFRALTEHSADAVALFDAEGRILHCRGASERILGYRPEELVGRSGFDLAHSEDRPMLRAALRQCITNTRRSVIRFRVRHRSGSIRWLEGVFNNLLDDPDVRAVVNNYRDITQAVAAEEALLKSEEKFAKAFRSSPLAITIATQAHGRYVDVNDAFLQMLGYERSAVIGRTAVELNVWADPEDRITMLQQLNDSSMAKGLHTRLRTSSGEIRETNVSAELIELDGAPCVLAITQDVTEAKRLENQFRQSQKMEAVGRLAGGVAHDFNNILCVIIGYSELSLHHLAPDHPMAKNALEVKNAANRAASLTRHLLAFSRQQVLYPRILDLNTVVHSLNQMLPRIIGDDISLAFKPQVPLGCIRADPGQIEQVLMNLVVNARDSMPKGGTIVIETSNIELDADTVDSHASVRPGRYVMLSVSDTGCGMDEKTVGKIFEPFFTTKAPGQGTGLGLSTVHGIVQQSHGHIWVYSQLGKGTTFKLYFPQHEESADAADDWSLDIEPVGGSETILVVEDDESLRHVTAALLESAGYQVLQADNAESAVVLGQEVTEPIDLLLTDALMAGMGGVELSARLKARRPHLKVLLMSGYAGDLIARYGAIEPEMALMEKPFTRHDLLSRIHTVLHK
jgi:two-component system cell cycle sensor histidine kinase/response regulator CckA